MSEKRQPEAHDRREAALERERADGAADGGDDRATDGHRKAADAHRHAANVAAALRAGDAGIEAERIAEPAPRAARADSETTPRMSRGDSPPDTAALDALIADTVEHAAAVAQAAHDAAEMAIQIVVQLAALHEERSRAHAVESAQSADTAGDDASVDGVPADVREVAVLEALAGGMSLADYLRDAILSHSAGSEDGAGGDLHARLRAARRKAARVRADSRAVRARSAQTAKYQS